MDYDRILLLDGGKLVEFDTPKNLLANPDSHLSTLVAASADADELRAIANEKI
jgi:ABC-type multidrug transport system fused ATPase/permease subunit